MRQQLLRVLALVVGCWLALGPLPTIAAKLTQPAADGYVGWYAAGKFLDGADPCDPAALAQAKLTGLGQPPTVALWFAPFARLPVEQMGTDVRLITIVALALHCVVLAAELGSAMPVALGLLLFGLVFSREFFLYHLDVAQISEWIACLILAAWCFRRRRQDGAAGFYLGLACTLKLFPALLVLLFALERRWRAVAVAVATWAVAVAVVTARCGVRLWPRFFAGDEALLSYWVPSIHNGSLYGIVTRYSRADAFAHAAPTRLATLLFVVLALALLAATAWLARRARGERDGELLFAWVAVLAPFLHPVEWEHYAVLWLLPLGILARSLGGVTLVPRLVAGLLTVVAAFCMSLPMHYRAVYQRRLVFAAHPQPRHMLQLFDVVNWLPSLALLCASALLLILSARARSRNK